MTEQTGRKMKAQGAGVKTAWELGAGSMVWIPGLDEEEDDRT
jgi:hypothetical protein